MTPTHLAALLALAFAAGAAPADIAGLRQPGTSVPAITLPSVAGGDLSLRSSPGVPTVLIVFGSWCDPCRRDLLGVVTLAHGSHVRFVGIDELEGLADARALVAAYKIPFPVALLTSPALEGANVTDDQRGATGIDVPAVYAIDAVGKSVQAFVGPDAFATANIEAAARAAARGK